VKEEVPVARGREGERRGKEREKEKGHKSGEVVQRKIVN
jgi:hypothetical protein